MIVDASELSVEEIQQQDAASGAYYSDREGFGATFQTGPGFGCVHWKERVAG
jgi:hypothetical protein